MHPECRIVITQKRQLFIHYLVPLQLRIYYSRIHLKKRIIYDFIRRLSHKSSGSIKNVILWMTLTIFHTIYFSRIWYNSFDFFALLSHTLSIYVLSFVLQSSTKNLLSFMLLLQHKIQVFTVIGSNYCAPSFSRQ